MQRGLLAQVTYAHLSTCVGKSTRHSGSFMPTHPGTPYPAWCTCPCRQKSMKVRWRRPTLPAGERVCWVRARELISSRQPATRGAGEAPSPTKTDLLGRTDAFVQS